MMTYTKTPCLVRSLPRNNIKALTTQWSKMPLKNSHKTPMASCRHFIHLPISQITNDLRGDDEINQQQVHLVDRVHGVHGNQIASNQSHSPLTLVAPLMVQTCVNRLTNPWFLGCSTWMGDKIQFQVITYYSVPIYPPSCCWDSPEVRDDQHAMNSESHRTKVLPCCCGHLLAKDHGTAVVWN